MKSGNTTRQEGTQYDILLIHIWTIQILEGFHVRMWSMEESSSEDSESFPISIWYVQHCATIITCPSMNLGPVNSQAPTMSGIWDSLAYPGMGPNHWYIPTSKQDWIFLRCSPYGFPPIWEQRSSYGASHGIPILRKLISVLHQEGLHTIDHLPCVMRHSKVGVSKSRSLVDHLQSGWHRNTNSRDWWWLVIVLIVELGCNW